MALVELPPAAATADGGGVFVPLTPIRLFDTAGARLSGGDVKTLSVTKTVGGVSTGVPSSNVSAVVVDVAAKDTSASNVYVYATEDTSPLAILSVGAGDVKDSNTVIVKVGADGKINLKVAAGSAEVNIDVQGYFTSTSTATSKGGFVPVTPSRLVNSTDGTGIAQGTVADGVNTVQVGGRAGVPAGATAIFANVRILNAGGAGGVRAGASASTVSTQMPLTDYTASGVYDSGATLDLDANGKLYVVVTNGTHPNIVIDVQGYFTSGSDGAGFVAAHNDRMWDSANSSGGNLGPGETRTVQLLNALPDDADPQSLALTIGVTDWSAGGLLSVASTDDGVTESAPSVVYQGTSDSPEQTTSIVIPGPDNSVLIKNSGTGTVRVLINLQGWFEYVDDDPDMADAADDLSDSVTDSDASDLATAIDSGAIDALNPDDSNSEQNMTTAQNRVALRDFRPLSTDPTATVGSGSYGTYTQKYWGACPELHADSHIEKLVRTFGRVRLDNPYAGTSMVGHRLSLRCGPYGQESSWGYWHLFVRKPKPNDTTHVEEFQNLAGYRNWRSFADWAIHWTVMYPTLVSWQPSNDRWCFSGPIYFKTGESTYKTRYIAVVTGRTARKLITTYYAGKRNSCIARDEQLVVYENAVR